MIDIKDLCKKTKNYIALCVDDEEKSRDELKGLLSLFFKEIYIAKDGDEALDLYYKNKNKIDIVFTDINMPKVDGLELSTKIKAEDPLQYIVVISARQDLKLYNSFINLGINGMIVKPITSNKVVDILIKAIDYLEKVKSLQIEDKKPHDICKFTEKTDPAIFIDNITGLYNKAKLDKHLITNNSFHLILINIDNFDSINCKYGYKIGDQVLQQIAKLLKEVFNKPCKLFRLVSDEFVFLLTNEESNLVEQLSKDVIKKLNNTKIVTQIDEFDISCTIGISFGSGQELLRQAHIAVKESRQIGKEKYYFFSNSSTILQQKENNLKWLKKIKKVLKEDSVIPYYQPIMDNNIKQIIKYESLARILEINRIVKPYYFLENAKLFNLVPNLTKLMVDKTFKYMSKYRFDFTINITKDDLQDPTFIHYIIKSARKSDIKNSRIIFEFLEDIITSKDENILDNLKLIRDEGFRIAIDDFGSHSSSFKALHSIKVDYIKIDGVFIENILIDKKAKKIVKSIVGLAKSIGAKTIAESVSTKEIQEKIQELGIDYSQGYYIGKPCESIEI